MKVYRICFHSVAVAIITTITFYTSNLRAQIVPDVTLPNNSSVTTRDNTKIIEGGTKAGGNLFHSFEQFSLPTNQTAYFNNTANIQNIITRITGKSISDIDGILRANGTANLFLINPNGIVFGENSSLDIGGSFLATTASSINFPDGTLFSATQPQNKPLLSVNVPIGLQFGATAAPIRNQSQALQDSNTNSSTPTSGLQVPRSKNLALIGGDVILEGGNLSLDSGRIELGSVGSNSLVSLNSINGSWIFGYEGVENFQNIFFFTRKVNGSEIPSYVIVQDNFGGGNIHLQGDLIELVGTNNISLINDVKLDDINSGKVNINARKLVVRDGAQINSFALSNSAVGTITVNASESVELIGRRTSSGGNFPSGLFGFASDSGKASNITINTNRLLIKNGAVISAESSGIVQNSQFSPATGEGGNITINANELVELAGSSGSFPSSLRASTTGVANAGKITISTKQLNVRDGAQIEVNSEILSLTQNITFVGSPSNFGNAGGLDITADSIVLDNQGKLISETESANGGDINLQLKDLLLLRRNSQISTNAGKAGLGGDGGNININIPNGFIVALPSENSDITANAFTGTGGRVDINATGIFGIQPRSRDELAEILATDNPSEINPQELSTSDITAISQQNPNLNGELNINVQDVEPTREVVELPNIPVDTKVSQVCRFRRGNQSQFVITNRGGLPPKPGEALGSNSALDVDWVELQEEGGTRMDRQNLNLNLKPKIRKPIVEATGWVTDKNGDIYFVAGTKEIPEKQKQVGC